MALIVSSAEDLFVFWQGNLKPAGAEHKAPCPFCHPNSKDGSVIFEGEDRFFFYPDMKGAFCRVCEREGRGDRGNGYFHLATIARRFGAQLSGDFDNSPPVIEEHPLSELWTDGQVALAHKKVDYAWWWKEYAWPKTLVDQFRLGMGNLYPDRWPHDYHLVPMKGLIKYGEKPIHHNYMAARFRASDGKKIKERGRGSSKPYLWLYTADQLSVSKEICLVEGDTDGITSSLLGYANFAATFGARTWTESKALLIKELGYERIYILADGDAAGKALAVQQSESLLRAGLDANNILILQWDEGDERDISKLYFDLQDPNEARAFINQRLVSPEARVMRRVNPYLDPQGPRELISRDELRGDSEKSMRYHIQNFLQAYEFLYRRGRGQALHLQAPAGSGKTHILIEIVEEIARKSLKANHEAREELIKTIDYHKNLATPDTETVAALERKLADWSFTSVAWYGLFKQTWDDLKETGANEALWYNYEARSEQNCQNFVRVNELGRNNHDIGYFCKRACPFFKECSETGYWAQEEERKSKPITFFRHQHLQAGHEQEYQAAVVVDEFAGHVLEADPVSYEAKHIYPSQDGWELDLYNAEAVKAILNFAEALRATLSSNAGAPMADPNYTISGAKFISKLNEYSLSIAKTDIIELLAKIDRRALHQSYQPNFSGGSEDLVHLRCLPQTYDVIMREIMDWHENPDNAYPSCLHLVSGVLEVYAPQRITNRQKTPMIIADATGMPSIYSAMFGREMQVYSPLIRNPNAEVIVLRGSDYTRNTINRQMGPALRDRKNMLAREERKVQTLGGDYFDPNLVPVGEDLYNSQVLREAMAITQELAKKHKSLLVVTHKNLRELMESLVETGWQDAERKEIKEHIAFGHYGNLRGTNRFKDYEAVALIGVFRIPYNIVWRRVQMWAWLLGIKEEVKPDIIREDDGYGNTYPTFVHQFAQAFIEMMEQGELQQSLARIRPHSSDEKKFIYYFGNRPAMEFVTKVTSKTDFLRGSTESKHKPLYDYMVETLRANNPMPSYSTLCSRFQCGNSTVSKLLTKAKMELGLR